MKDLLETWSFQWRAEGYLASEFDDDIQQTTCVAESDRLTRDTYIKQNQIAELGSVTGTISIVMKRFN